VTYCCICLNVVLDVTAVMVAPSAVTTSAALTPPTPESYSGTSSVNKRKFASSYFSKILGLI